MLGLKPETTKPALILGGAIHEAMAEFYSKLTTSTDPMADAINTGLAELDSRFEEYEKEEDYEIHKIKLQQMLEAFEPIGMRDQNIYDIVEVEEEHTVPLGPDDCFNFTVRFDRVFKHKYTGVYYVPDTKTSGWSITKALDSNRKDPQFLCYAWAFRKLWPDRKFGGVFVDQLYQRTYHRKDGTVSYSDAEAVRDDPIPDTTIQQTLDLWAIQFVGTIIELSQKVKALSQGIPWPLLFPIHYEVEKLFGCEYEGICNKEVEPGDIPPGFVRDEWSDLETIHKRVAKYDLKDWRI